MKIIAAETLLQGMKKGIKPAPFQAGSDSDWLTKLYHLFLSMHIYEELWQKIVFSGPHIYIPCYVLEARL